MSRGDKSALMPMSVCRLWISEQVYFAWPIISLKVNTSFFSSYLFAAPVTNKEG